jgi:hypothetical protein
MMAIRSYARQNRIGQTDRPTPTISAKLMRIIIRTKAECTFFDQTSTVQVCSTKLSLIIFLSVIHVDALHGHITPCAAVMRRKSKENDA